MTIGTRNMLSRTALVRAGIVVLLMAAVVSLVVLPVAETLSRFLDWVAQQSVLGPLSMIVAYVLACVLLIPGSILTLGSGFLFGPILGTVVVSIGSTLGATAAFLTGRYLARGWVQRKMEVHPKFRVVNEAIGRQGFKIVLLMRLSPAFPFNLLNYGLGLTDVSLRKYVLASWLGMLPATIVYVYLGSAAKNLTDVFTGKVEVGIAQQILFGAGLFVAVAVAVLVARIAKRALSGTFGDDDETDPTA